MNVSLFGKRSHVIAVRITLDWVGPKSNEGVLWRKEDKDREEGQGRTEGETGERTGASEGWLTTTRSQERGMDWILHQSLQEEPTLLSA